jgi:hypothetical protein
MVQENEFYESLSDDLGYTQAVILELKYSYDLILYEGSELSQKEICFSDDYTT